MLNRLTCVALAGLFSALPSVAAAFPAPTETATSTYSATAYVATTDYSTTAENDVTVVGNNICIEIPVTLLICRHEYGDPKITEETKIALPAGTTVDEAKKIGVKRCEEEGAKIRARLDKEAGGKDKSRKKYPAIRNLIGAVDIAAKLKICIPLPFGAFFGAAAQPVDSDAADSTNSLTDSLANGAIEPSDLTEAQIAELRGLASSEEFIESAYVELNIEVGSN